MAIKTKINIIKINQIIDKLNNLQIAGCVTQKIEHITKVLTQNLSVCQKSTRPVDILNKVGYNCSSISKLVKILLDELNIENYIQVGYLKMQYHCWNIVEGQLIDFTSLLSNKAYLKSEYQLKYDLNQLR